MGAGHPLFSLAGRTVVVTGTARGNGAAIARGLLDAGATVIGVDRLPAPDWPAAATVGARFRPIVADLADGTAVDALAADLVAGGRIHGLVNNAGISLSGPDAYADALWAATLAVDLEAPFRLIRALAPAMAAAGGGSIVNVTSLGSLAGFPGNPAYQVAKAGLAQLTRASARDFGAGLVRVNNLCPGYMVTDMTAASYADPIRRAERTGRMMLPRWGEPDDLVGPCLFLLSDASRYVTGTDLVVDGGWMAKGL